MDEHQNQGTGSYPDMGMVDHQNLEYDFLSKSRVWILSKSEYGSSSKSRSGSYPDISMDEHTQSMYWIFYLA